jgi:hypothetical protein
MPTVLQRLKNLTATDPSKRRRFLAARKWARDRAPDHVVHIDGVSVQLFPHGGFGSVAGFDDEQLHAFLEFLVFARCQYLDFEGRATR